MPGRVVFLESFQGQESLFTRGLRSGASKQAWNNQVIFLRDKGQKEKDVESVREEILEAKPDIVAFIMDAPLPWGNSLWQDAYLEDIPKYSFWFDDFYRSPWTLKEAEKWSQWQKDFGVQVYMWDGYWREKWQTHTGYPALPVHLAADPDQLNPAAKASFPSLDGKAVMVGTIPSKLSLEAEAEALPAPIGKLLRQTIQNLELAPWPIQPYEMWERILEEATSKDRLICERWSQTGTHIAVLNHQLWRWGKRITRLRGLKAIGKTHAIAVISGHRTEHFAKQSELEEEVRNGCGFEFFDSTDLDPQSWSGLFRSGKIQLQFTDPQSIQGGIPFRVFECAASKAPLLTDLRPELKEIFPSSSNLILCQDEQDMACQIPKERPEEDAHLYSEFLDKHTWQSRWAEITSAKK